MGGKGNKKKKNKPQGDASEDPSPRNTEQNSANQSTSNNQQESHNRPTSDDPQGLSNQPGSSNQQVSDNKPKSKNQKGSGNQSKSKNEQGSDSKPRGNSPQISDKPTKSNNPQGSASRPGSNNQKASDNKPTSNNPQGADNQQRSDNKPKSKNNQQILSPTITEQLQQLSTSSENQSRQQESRKQTEEAPQAQSEWGQQSKPAPQDEGSWRQQSKKASQDQGAWGQQSKHTPQDEGSWRQQSKKASQDQGAWGQQSKPATQDEGSWRQQSKKASQDQGAWGQQSKPTPQDEGSWRQQSKNASQDQGAWEESSKSTTPNQPPNQQRDDSMAKQSPARSSRIGSPTTKMPHLLCPYKGPGTRGNKYRELLETNYLKLVIDKLKNFAYHYDVQIEPDKPKKHMSKIFHQFCVNNFPGTGIAFDGSRNAYAPMRLNLNDINREVDFTHPDTGSVRKYLVAIKETEDMEIPLNSLRTYQTTRQYDTPKKALQCLEIILKGAYHQPHLDMGVQAARSFYLPTQKRDYLGDFFELWLGLFQSTVLGSNIYLNVDVAHKAFPKRYASLTDLLDQIMAERRCNVNDALYTMKSHLSGLDLIYQTPGNAGNKRVYKFLGLVGPPNRERFTDANGREVTIADYFKEQNFAIRNPELPCVKIGNTIKNITVPMEHCALSDRQAINKKCTENQTRAIIRYAATPTDVRKKKILELVKQIAHNQSPIIRGFGLQVATDFLKVQARRLDPPKIQYAHNKSVEVRNGVWRGEGMPFLIPESANKWAILNANQRTRNEELQDLSGSLFRVSRPTNLNLADKPTYIRSVDSRNFANIQKELENAKREGIRILFCVIPDAGQTYSKIKQLAETRIGVLTQCIKGGTVFKKRTDGSTISNILLKVNAKLNGTNHRLNDSPILYDKCMLIGADVTHPSPEQRHIPSVVGVAASHDANAFCYNVCWRLQGPRIEIIEDFKQILLEHLKFYRQKNGCLPNKILYYRDGVSEGQFQQVMASEKMAMTQACALIEPGYEKKVKLTIIVVQKRHHTRFFPGTTKIGQGDRNNNVPAGTIVDTEITHPNENHFYLVSHQSIQGVAKPTKYCILLDEANHSIDDLQGLSFNLCHLFSRCNRSVSYPAPTYYAHLAAYRGRVYIENENLNMNRLTDEWKSRAIRDDIARVHPMFFV